MATWEAYDRGERTPPAPPHLQQQDLQHQGGQ